MVEIFIISRISLRRLLTRARFWFALLLAFGTVLTVFANVPAYLADHGYQIQIFEPFLILLPSVFPQILLLISFLLLVGDIPFLYTGMELTALRSSRQKWLAGQLLAALGAATIWLLFILLCTVLLFCGQVSVQNQWSLLLKAIARSHGVVISVGMSLVRVTTELITGANPYERVFWMLLFQLLMFWSFTLWSLLFNLWTRRSYGCLLTVGFWVFRRHVGELSLAAGRDLSWISPMSLVDLCETRLTAARIVFIVLIFLTQICLLWGLSAIKLQRMDISQPE